DPHPTLASQGYAGSCPPGRRPHRSAHRHPLATRPGLDPPRCDAVVGLRLGGTSSAIACVWGSGPSSSLSCGLCFIRVLGVTGRRVISGCRSWRWPRVRDVLDAPPLTVDAFPPHRDVPPHRLGKMASVVGSSDLVLSGRVAKVAGSRHDCRLGCPGDTKTWYRQAAGDHGPDGSFPLQGRLPGSQDAGILRPVRNDTVNVAGHAGGCPGAVHLQKGLLCRSHICLGRAAGSEQRDKGDTDGPVHVRPRREMGSDLTNRAWLRGAENDALVP